MTLQDTFNKSCFFRYFLFLFRFWWPIHKFSFNHPTYIHLKREWKCLFGCCFGDTAFESEPNPYFVGLVKKKLPKNKIYISYYQFGHINGLHGHHLNFVFIACWHRHASFCVRANACVCLRARLCSLYCSTWRESPVAVLFAKSVHVLCIVSICPVHSRFIHYYEIPVQKSGPESTGIFPFI